MVPDLPEGSGLAVSRLHPGILWSHNDSGNEPILFALDEAGAVRGRIRVPLTARDWEDVAVGHCAAGMCLYIGDIGDNALRRSQIQVYRLAEPELETAIAARPDRFAVTYADGPHNAEAMAVIGDILIVITRDRTGGVYRGVIPSGARGDITLTRAGAVGLAAVTDAEASPDEQTVIVRTSDEAVFYRAADLASGHEFSPVRRIPLGRLREAQGEGIAVDANGVVYLMSEGSWWNRAGRFISMRCPVW
jgi:hypothetical protein